MNNSYIFPPIVDTYQKAFVIGGDKISVTENGETVTKSVIKIKYRVPATGGNTGSIEVSIRNQYNNLSVLKNGQDTITASVGEDYIYILQSEVNVGLNQWYRVQLRYRVENQQNNTISYSEWSTVTLIKAISAPSVELGTPFAKDPENPSNPIIVNSQSVTVQGSIQFDNKNDDETLQSYEIELLQKDADNNTYTIIEKSGVLYPDFFNARAIGPYQLKSTLQFLNNANYQLKIRYTTKSFYVGEKSVDFTYLKGDPTALEGDFFVTANHNKGYNEIQVGLYKEDYIQTDEDGKDIGNKIFKIQRSSYRNNHTTRETLFTIDLNKYNSNYPKVSLKDPYSEVDAPTSTNTKTYAFSQVLADTTAEPGVLYRYYLVNMNGADYTLGEDESSPAYIECMLDVEHIFFTDINSQFRLNLNPNISNFKYVVQESVTNTLGSAFPFVRRSGHTKYRQFSISGTICGYGDDEGIFLSRNSASLISSQGFYDRYKAQNRIMPWNDYIFEKQYRDKAIEFLMDGKPKLFKSFTEGNMVVALTAVSFTPNKQLDRNVYDFSATVTEIAECTVENCQKYNCYENEAYKMFVPTEYYLVAEWTEQINDMIAAIQANNPYMNYAGQGYLCVHEVTSMLQAYSPSSELDEILANDSVIRGGTT